jgi:molybdopterin-guanine dinucleotide biosynthesis protein A
MNSNTHEAVILTGGTSRRMGTDKAMLQLCGEPVAGRLTQQFREVEWPVTVLGNHPIPGARLIPDKQLFAGPLACLRDFVPECDFVFVLSCDVPLFDSKNAQVFLDHIGLSDAIFPILDGFDQPLCGLYTANAFSFLRENPEWVRLKDWTAALNVIRWGESDLSSHGIDVDTLQGANTKDEFQKLTGETI